MTEQKNPAKNLDQRMLSFVDPLGRLLTDGFHILALFAIGAATVLAAAAAFIFAPITCRCGSCSMSGSPR
jgi:hypothetical protein